MGDKLHITVIATGFGEAEATALRPATEASYRLRTGPAPASRSSGPSSRVAMPARPSVREQSVREPSVRESPKRVVRMGLIVDGDTPVWQRRRGEEPIDDAGGKVDEESEYDIPTFLRKQAD